MPRTPEANLELKELRCLKIINAAAKVFSRRGYGDTKIADIALEAEMSQGLIYRYFESKEAVYAAILEPLVQISTDMLRQMQSMEGSAWNKLVWLTEQLLPYQYYQPDFPVLVVHTLANQAIPPKIREMVMGYTANFQAEVSQLIKQAQVEGKIAQQDSDSLAMLYTSTLQGLAVGALHLNYPPEKYPTVEIFMQMFKAP